MLVLLVLFIILGILIYAVALPYCVNNRKVIYAKNKKYFNAPIAYTFTSFIVAGICVLIFGIISFVMPQFNIASTKDSIGIVGCGLAILAVGILIGIIPIKKAATNNHKGVVKDMIIASIGSITALWIAFLPFISDYSQKKYKQYLAEEKQRENMRRAEQERINNSRLVNKNTGEKSPLNSDGSKAYENGEWIDVNDAIATGDYKLTQ